MSAPAVGGASASSDGGSVAAAGTANGAGAASDGGVSTGGVASTASGGAGLGGAGLGGAGLGGGGLGGGGLGGLGGAGDLAQPSCAQLASTCGPAGNASCCRTSGVSGGSYDRRENGQDFPATVSDFVLDTYEITVGRFRKFFAVYAPDMIPPGAGKNPNNPADPGWDRSWNASLDPDAAALKAALACDASFQTWTDSPVSAAAESLPIDCLSWFDAEAFCIWDNGRLPTDAEWTYVAAAGAEQRLYPWGSAAPDCSFANFYGAAGGADFCVQPGVGASNRVGSESPKGDSKWGQTDMGGNMAEWVQDWARLYSPGPCNDCAALVPGASSHRLLKGGSFGDTAQTMTSGFRVSTPPDVHLFGARCARAAPTR